MNTSYDTDVIAWANEQAALIRAGRFDQLDLTHIAEEIEDVGKSEQRELASRMAVLLMHLIQWGFQPTLRSASWTNTLRHQRSAIDRRIKGTPSLKPLLEKPDWVQDAWDDALVMAQKETGIDIGALPDVCPWAMADVLAVGWLPK